VGHRGATGVITVLVAPGSLLEGAEVQLEEAESHHLRVRRAAAGAAIRLMDGQGAVAEGVLVRPGDAAAVTVGRVRVVPRPTPLRLVVGGGDRDRFGWLAEKAAELGVTELVPLETARTAGVATRVRDSHVDRLQRRALEAIKQSGAAWAPVVSAPIALEHLPAQFPDGNRWVADVEGEAPPSRLCGPLTAVIGPEGGLTDAERGVLRGAGWRPLRLGANTLRFETAAVAIAVLAHAPHFGADRE